MKLSSLEKKFKQFSVVLKTYAAELKVQCVKLYTKNSLKRNIMVKRFNLGSKKKQECTAKYTVKFIDMGSH
jgi:hypothetical protein